MGRQNGQTLVAKVQHYSFTAPLLQFTFIRKLNQFRVVKLSSRLVTQLNQDRMSRGELAHRFRSVANIEPWNRSHQVLTVKRLVPRDKLLYFGKC